MFFFGNRKITAVLAAFIFLGLFGWFWRHRESVPFVSQPLSLAAAPFEYGTSRLAQGIHTGVDIIDGSLTRWQENENLKTENGTLKAEQAQYNELLAENTRLRSMLGFKAGYPQFHLLGTKVIAREYGLWTNTMVIDRGSDSGLTKYMPVIVPQGLVGFISEVYPNSARVQLLNDPRTSAGAIIQRPASRVASIVNGNGSDPDHLIFGNITKEADVVKGDTLVTSGYGGVYPHGLLIGTVDQVVPEASGVVSEAYITPAVNFRQLEEVFVITNHIEKTPPDKIRSEGPMVEAPMNPNAPQAGGGK